MLDCARTDLAMDHKHGFEAALAAASETLLVMVLKYEPAIFLAIAPARFFRWI